MCIMLLNLDPLEKLFMECLKYRQYYRRSRIMNHIFLGSSVVEHAAVNRQVAGSNPARGAEMLHIIYFIVFLSCAFVLHGCNSVFTPEVQTCFARVYVEPIPEYSGFLLRSKLQRMLSGDQSTGGYTLELTIETLERALEMGEDAKITLLHVVVKAPFKLKYGQIPVYQGQGVVYYYRTLTPSFYSQTTTQHYISQEAAHQLAQNIFLELGKFFSRTLKRKRLGALQSVKSH